MSNSIAPMKLSREQIDFILSPKAIRARSKEIFELTKAGRGSFEIHEDRLRPTVDYVMSVIKKNYPDGKIPFHSRWGHFRAGGVNRPAEMKKLLLEKDPIERARTELDLVITSVLLDAGAGAAWSYKEDSSAKTFDRSEGLGVASYHMFLSGVMSSDRLSLRADSEGLKKISVQDVETHFQVSGGNPLVGVEGRVALLNGLGRAVSHPARFKDGRPGNIVDYLISKHGKTIPAPAILRAVLEGFGSIWPGRLAAVGPDGSEVNLGDVWKHSSLGDGGFDSLVPIHKLSQWMTYSLIEPMLDAGLTVNEVEGLTGLAEYRNGGLLIDMGLLSLRDPSKISQAWKPDSDLVIEWRALTVYFLDLIGDAVQKALGRSPAEFPLAKVLEGGTWWAGRFIAKEKRPSADPPLQIASDGTVF